ncbi:uncharacterized protein LOC114360905 [Ostrinia furnacalis]|uniref:uncharacterized protein LOC114360905 n=1 Tax=Ostrinia furnacalis TaxID=93504 RepID=UPI00103B9A13|nr:uncharacterized protein LOC114360905 [Ostrinia furnacalis]
MSSLAFWTIFAVLYQTVFSIIISWLILSCKLPPTEGELQEVTLLKLLYLHDPEACGRVYFYNYTRTYPVPSSSIVWPVKNEVASLFRGKICAWLSLHVIWAVLGIAYMTQGQRPCGLYVTLMPFTLTGLAILVMDLVYTTMFLMDARKTSTEAKILNYINSDSDSIRIVNKTHQSVPASTSSGLEKDTSWIALLLAYISCRALVQWIVNFWIVKDNYIEGMAYYSE